MRIDEKKTPLQVTVLLTAGRVPTRLLSEVHDVVRQYGLSLYLTTAQNLRLLGMRAEDITEIQDRLVVKGATIKALGMFPVPRVCVGEAGCKLGLIDTFDISKKIVARFGPRKVKPKFKIAIAACPASCANALSTDIGLVATRAGYDIYVGGKGGIKPAVGRRIVRKADEDKVFEVIENLVNFHQEKTGEKQRFHKLLEHPEFPYPQAV
ncbi:MAG: hypothetical protein A2511_07995 [Deltaproteobacteria bacterium RIFOXYD12_FULL_50_9]|nr:MAG: hypothetical protein A2511_07995 [Deltaproteobacteria bacterium RIFOXYD12_FULL_50_9]